MPGRPASSDELGMALGAALAVRRSAAGLTRGQLARLAGVSSNTLMKIEQGRVASPGISCVDRLARALALKIDDLLEEARKGSDRGDPLRPIISVGYEGRSATELLEELTAAGVDTLIDVRLNAISRKRGLSKSALASELAEVGIEYVHHRALGNPKHNRAAFGLEPAVGRARYLELLRTAEARSALDDVAVRAGRGLAAVLCFESDHTRCHRSVVVEEVAALRSLHIVAF